MKEIPEDLVTDTWQAASALPPEQAHREMEKAGREQPELLAFVLGSVMDCGQEAQELAVYLYFVIHKIFKNAAKNRLRPITAAKIKRRLTQNEDHLSRIEGAHPRFVERAAALETRPQPFVVKYLVEAIVEAPECGDPVDLTDEESGTLFLVLKTVIDLLDEERERAGKKGKR
ncbi:MAG: hypothetical protein JW821_01170 [Deltaproteobacteria bacterium]|nr:hypothetical protein [Deltaproteobacteria bacterium]